MVLECGKRRSLQEAIDKDGHKNTNFRNMKTSSNEQKREENDCRWDGGSAEGRYWRWAGVTQQ
ncbi:hypothetical protein E2C01_098078 [Portunus trituberculatus]|uniref:Uncharacterized protein n=1 Tax=Portunus trituberculatus TaxID=210409 RepID=A0A5B7K0A9_PORTR|nr:hypothetical protein [Portunus trituberculatus]